MGVWRFHNDHPGAAARLVSIELSCAHSVSQWKPLHPRGFQARPFFPHPPHVRPTLTEKFHSRLLAS